MRKYYDNSDAPAQVDVHVYTCTGQLEADAYGKNTLRDTGTCLKGYVFLRSIAGNQEAFIHEDPRSEMVKFNRHNFRQDLPEKQVNGNITKQGQVLHGSFVHAEYIVPQGTIVKFFSKFMMQHKTIKNGFVYIRADAQEPLCKIWGPKFGGHATRVFLRGHVLSYQEAKPMLDKRFRFLYLQHLQIYRGNTLEQAPPAEHPYCVKRASKCDFTIELVSEMEPNLVEDGLLYVVRVWPSEALIEEYPSCLTQWPRYFYNRLIAEAHVDAWLKRTDQESLTAWEGKIAEGEQNE